MKQLFLVTVIILIASCRIPIDPNPKQEVLFEHTIMIYANADNSLEADILADIQEWEQVQTVSDSIKVVILLDRAAGYSTVMGDWHDSRAFELQPDSSVTEIGSLEIGIPELNLQLNTITELDMGNPWTLKSFMQFCQRKYPAGTYSLILSGHGDGWFIDPARAISPDSSSGHELDPLELAAVISKYPVNVLSLDACSMGGVEVVAELAGLVDFVIASPTTIPSGSYNNFRLYTDLLNTSTDDAKAIAESFVNAYSRSSFGGQSYMFAYDPLKTNTAIRSVVFKQWIQLLIQDVSVVSSLPNSSRFYVEGRQSYIDLLALPDCPASIGNAILAPENIAPSLSVYFPFEFTSLDSSYFDALSFQRETGWQNVIKTFHGIE